MKLADYRRFVSYIYAYRNGKKEKNTGFAKVEARKRNLRISIQLEAPENRETSLDAYGFIRKGEKIFGIFLGEMQKSSGPLYFLKVETDTDNIKESGHGLNQLSGLWIKGEAGENYITIWDDEPVKRMDLEIEMEEEEPVEIERLEEIPAEASLETPSESELVESAPTEVFPEPEHIDSTLDETSREPEIIESVPEETSLESKHIESALAETSREPKRMEPAQAETLLEPERIEPVPAEPEVKFKKPLNGVRAQEAEFIAGLEASETDLPETNLEPEEDCVPEEIMPDSAAGEAPNDQAQEVKASASGYTERYASLWERLSPAYAHRNPFEDGEATDAILISPRELHFFCCKGWSAAKNSFIYHGYYNFHHLLFGKAADGTFFLAVPGTYSPQEQRMATSFGFPLFKENRDKAPACRRGYWCRLL